jgi:UDP-N-acetylmuramate dehydrogenase
MRLPESGACMATLTTLGVGGPARWLVSVESAEDVRLAHAWARDRGVPVTVLAGGSNVVVADEGVDGLVLLMRGRGVSQVDEGDDVLVTAQAGEPWDDFVAATVEQGLAGLECLSGIPGTVGGTPIQNVGAYGQEVSAVVERVTVFDRLTTSLQPLTADACAFGYRTSRFKTSDVARFILCDVTFRLRHAAPTLTYPDLARQVHDTVNGGTPTLLDARAAVLAVRRRKGMVLDASDTDTRSVGSFFTNPVITQTAVDELARHTETEVPAYPAGPGRMKVPAAWLLERAGFTRGYGSGAVGLSSKHTLAIINRGGATAGAVVAFAAGIKRRVADTFGVTLMPEPTFVGFRGADEVTYLVAGTA